MAELLLPGGWLDAAGSCHQEAAIRPACGEDEEWLYGLPLTTPEPAVVTGLLTRCLTRVGPHAPPGRDVVRSLPVGDREWLILRLWRLTLGDRVELVVTCPQRGCGTRMDLDFALEGLVAEPRPQRPSYSLDPIGLRFRLPHGDDLEALGRALAEEESGGGVSGGGASGGGASETDRAAALLGRCMIPPPSTAEVTALLARTPGLWEGMAEEMRRHSALVDREFDAVCPQCEREFTGEFDPILAFLTEMMRRRPEFERDVHLLSLHYHWPLSEILNLARSRRRRYVRLLLDQLDVATG
ncbi:hypothetical protein ACIBQ1_24150 [Nonomuraea sp. NPDC050153]|uniref:T4 family baseplate hub assembly chaperone n=1 Tax=Nonomuraea sp. NPDC050153 TaxID=3364359 RepID=UPI00378BCADF